jgi:hypothetical protein
VSGVLILSFVFLWFEERPNSRKGPIAYCPRSSEDQAECYKINLTGLETGLSDTMSRLEDIGEGTKDQWRSSFTVWLFLLPLNSSN